MDDGATFFIACNACSASSSSWFPLGDTAATCAFIARNGANAARWYWCKVWFSSNCVACAFYFGMGGSGEGPDA